MENTEFYGELQGETDKCWFVFDGIETVAVPKRLATVRMINSVDCEITVPAWFARNKGIV